MKHCLLVAFLALAGVGVGAGCDDGSAAKPDASIEPDADAGAPDAAIPRDVSPPPDTQPQSPDTTADTSAVAADATPDSAPAVDSGASDAATGGARDGAGSADTAPVTGATCGPGASREMLCTSYCDGMGRFCTGSNGQYRSAEECRAACVGPTWACGSPGETTGNSLFCRLAHMTLAGVASAATECPNAGPSSPTCQ